MTKAKNTTPADLALHIAAPVIFKHPNLLKPNPWNEARPLDDAFTDSIREKGIMNPILCRMMGDGSKSQIIFGQRRTEAAKKLGYETVPIRVIDCTEQEAQEMTLIENTHRTDLNPWQRSQALKKLAELPGWDLDKAAKTLGWSKPIIAKALKLLDLSENWQKIANKPPLEYERWSWPIFEEIALYPQNLQDEVLARLDLWAIQRMTVKIIRQVLGNHTHQLNRAKWDLDDELLVAKAGPCSKCPKRTGARPDLFENVTVGKNGTDSCTDSPCWESKNKAFAETAEIKAKEKHPDILILSSNHDGNKKRKDALAYSKWDKAGQSTPGSKRGIIVDGEEAGTIYWATVRKDTQSSGRGHGGGSASRKAEPKVTSLSELREGLDKRRAIHAAEKVLEELVENNSECPPKKITVLIVAGLAANFGTIGIAELGWKELGMEIAKGEQAVLDLLWPVVADKLASNLRYDIRNKDKKTADNAEHVADLIGVSWKELKAAADLAIKEPAAWAKRTEAEKPAKPATKPKATAQKKKGKKKTT